MLGRRAVAPLLGSLSRRASAITIGKAQYEVPQEGMTLLRVLRHHALHLDFQCQEGQCRKCEVDVELGGERAAVLACQELAVDGMRVVTDIKADPVLERLRRQQARETAQKQALHRRGRPHGPIRGSTKSRSLDPRLQSAAAIRIQEVLNMGAGMHEPHVEVLNELRTLLEGLPAKELRDVNELLGLAKWLKEGWRTMLCNRPRAAAIQSFIDECLDQE